MSKRVILHFCYVPFCNNNDKQRLTFHAFPSNVEMRKKWLKILKIKESAYRKPMSVCNAYFICEDYFPIGEDISLL